MSKTRGRKVGSGSPVLRALKKNHVERQIDLLFTRLQEAYELVDSVQNKLDKKVTELNKYQVNSEETPTIQ